MQQMGKKPLTETESKCLAQMLPLKRRVNKKTSLCEDLCEDLMKQAGLVLDAFRPLAVHYCSILLQEGLRCER